MSYPKWNTHPIKCGSRKCDWTGMEGDLGSVPDPSSGILKVSQNVCPKCGSNSYSFAKIKKPCIICGIFEATVPDRDCPGRPVKKVCSRCHGLRLAGDLAKILELEAQRRQS